MRPIRPGETCDAPGLRASVDHAERSKPAAVEEQSGVTREMSAGIRAAGEAVAGISRNIEAIGQSVSVVSHAVGETKEAARVLVR